jgi:hypothetical protein
VDASGAAAAAPVQSVNSLSGTVVLDAAAVGAYPDSNPSGFVDAAGAALAAPVQSVNGAVGTVSVNAVGSADLPITYDVGTQTVGSDGSLLVTVEHGGDDSEPRPSYAATVYWKGTVAPVNGVAGDLWYDTTGSPDASVTFTHLRKRIVACAHTRTFERRSDWWNSHRHYC